MNPAQPIPVSPRQDRSAQDGPACILTTGDRPEIVDLIDRSLREDYRCEFATDVDDARQMLAAGDFDLLLCDLHPPIDPVLALAEEIATGAVDTAVVLIADTDDAELAKKAFSFGAYGYIVTPLWPGELLMTAMNSLRRHQLELDHREHTQNQRDQRQTIIDRAPMPIYAKDLTGRYVLANAMADELAGLKRGEMLGLTDAEIMPPAEAMGAAEVDRGVAENGTIFEATDVVSVAGARRTFKTVKFPLSDEDEEIVAVAGISTDVTAELDAAILRNELVVVQAHAIKELELSRYETVERLTTAIDRHDSSTGEHVARMADVAALLGQEMGLDGARVELLRTAAPMHDVGKIGTPDEILRKPGPLSDEERTVMQRHTLVGYEILSDSKSELLRLGATIALTHHECFDGGGYPHGLAGEEIPLEGRITAVADVFDALLSDRVYRPALSVDQTVKILRKDRGTHLDPKIVDILIANLERALAVRAG